MLDDIYRKTGTRYNVSSVSVPHTDLEAELIGLEKYREYVIWTAAYTVVGHGSMNSSLVKQMTDEDGKNYTAYVIDYTASSLENKLPT